jgi:EAL domain-containing protein (putative c-di-GMP-specific phosphodiesterase class I)
MMDRDTKEPFCALLRGLVAGRQDRFGAMSQHRLPGFRPELAKLQRCFGVGKVERGGGRAALCVVATIANLSQIERAHGSMFATTARQVLRERARELCRRHSGTVAMSGKHMLFVFDVFPHARETHGGPGALPSRLLDLILTSLSERPIRIGLSVAFPVIDANVAHFDDKPFNIGSVNAASHTGVSSGGDSLEQFVADTRVAESVFSALNDHRLDFDFERICDAKETATTLYLEALLCRTGGALHERCRIGSEIRALERLGVVRCLDRWVIRTVIDRLRANPEARLGCNISTRSAVIDGWWGLVLTTLAFEPDVASRLTVEITETFPLTNLDATREFVAVLRSVGCRVALDNVGHDFGSLRKLISLGVDIVKLDRSLVAGCRDDEAATARFAQLIELAKVCAGAIVVEGIETINDAQTACANGATGLQGYLYHPSAN